MADDVSDMEEALADLSVLRVWLSKHRPDRPGGTGLSAQAWVDLAEIMADERRKAGEQIAQAIEERLNAYVGSVDLSLATGWRGGMASAADVAREVTR